MRAAAIAMLLIVVLSSCGGDSTSTPAETSPVSQSTTEKIAALEADGSIPTLDRSPTLAGPDSDRNGIRDDVDAYVDRLYVTDRERSAGKQFAFAMQAALTSDKSSKLAVERIAARSSRAINCIYTVFAQPNSSQEPALVLDELEAITANTKSRFLEYVAYSAALDGTSITLPDGDTCE